jgi:Protein of unknown function (DUF3618)
MTADLDRSMDEIELEIARTRARLANTADSLAAELAPRVLVEKGADMVSGFFGRAGAVGLGGGMRADPVALALIGLGSAWLVAENMRLLDGLLPKRADEAPPSNEPIVALSVEPLESPQVGDGWLHQAVGATRGAPRSVYDCSAAATEPAGETVAHPADSGEPVRQLGGRMIENVQRSPLLLGLVGLAAGAAIAMMLPTSRRERRIAAQTRDDLWDKAEEFGHRAANSIREIAEDSAHASAVR